MCFVGHRRAKTHGGMGVELHALLTFASDGGEMSAACRSYFTPGSEQEAG